MVVIGEMGQEVIKQMAQYEDLVLLGGCDKENSGAFSFPVYTSTSEISEKPDVIIDFSIPIATLNILKYAKENNIPVVIATTGFTKEHEDTILEYSRYIPIFKSANMSFDIYLMTKVLKMVAKELKGTDIEICETHHNRKIDSPSGTALLLANSINTALNHSLNYEFDRHQKREKRSKSEIGFSSIRGGNIVGEHTVYFFGQNETFEISHKAYSRSIFADGAIKAAKFLITQKPGMYNMENL